MDEDYKIRFYEAGDEAGVVELLRSVFPEWGHSEDGVDFWRWKYLSTPLGSSVGVATLGGKVVAVDHFMTLRMKIGANVVLTQYMDDGATHPDHREKRLFRKIDNLLEAEQESMGIKTTYTIPTNPITIKHRKPWDVFLPRKVIHVIRIIDPENYLITKGVTNPKLSGLAYKALRLSRLEPKTRRSDSSNIRIEETTRFDESVDKLWEDISHNLTFAIDRSLEYLNWRYCDPRGGKMILFQAYNDERLVGYLATEIRTMGEKPEAYILDLVTHPEFSNASKTLTSALLDKVDNLGINAINYRAVEGHPSLRMLRNFGFVKPPFQRKMILRIGMKYLPLNQFDEVTASPPQKIHFTYGDYF